MTCTSPVRLALMALAAGCPGAATEGPDDFGYEGTGIAFNVAPLTLDALADACYSFAVYNEQGELVVGRGPGAAAGVGGGTLSGTELQTVCASQFGNGSGGDVSYVAPCDAQAPPANVGDGDAVNTHTVRLWVDALCTSAVADKSGVAVPIVVSIVTAVFIPPFLPFLQFVPGSAHASRKLLRAIFPSVSFFCQLVYHLIILLDLVVALLQVEHLVVAFLLLIDVDEAGYATLLTHLLTVDNLLGLVDSKVLLATCLETLGPFAEA